MDGFDLNLANPGLASPSELVPAAGASWLLPWLRRIPAAGWIPARRLPLAFGLLLAFEILALLLFIAVSHHWVGPLNKPTTTDFASFYAAGSLTDAGHPALAYDLAAHRAAEEQATEPGINYQYFYYPPVFLFICAALAKLPYLPAFIVFQALTLPLYLFVGRRTLNETSWTALLALLAFPAVFWNIGLGQNAFLTAALFGGGLLLIDRRPVLAGILFGALCYKPHFGLLVPVALAAGGRWRAFAAAAASATALVLLSAAVFGGQSWHDYLGAFAGSNATYGSGYIDMAAFVTPYGAVRLVGGSVGAAYAAQAAASLFAIGLVAFVWRKHLSLPLRAAALLAATLIAVPVALIYDEMLAALAIAWLVRAGRADGFLQWEKAILAAIFIAPLISRNFGMVTHIPIAIFATAALLGMNIVRARKELARSARGILASGERLAASTEILAN
jgi:alpha-1,2-mannosyltransferase